MNAFHIIAKALRQLNFRKVVKLAALVLHHPWFSALALYATVKTFDLAKKNFPETHSSDGVGNAFRHALWPCLIMSYCCKISSPEKAEKFSRKMTNLHEELFPNPPLQRAMDLHNNEVGYRLFRQMLKGVHRQFFETSFFVQAISKKTHTAKVVATPQEIPAEDLVYLG